MTSQPKVKKPPGRPAHKPTAESREAVRLLAVAGVNQDCIGKRLGITDDTLRKHYRAELDCAAEDMVVNVTKNLVRIASEGNGSEAVTAAKFILERRGGDAWRQAATVAAPDGQGMRIVFGGAEA